MEELEGGRVGGREGGRAERWGSGFGVRGSGFGVRSVGRWALRVTSHGPHHHLDTEPKFIPNFAVSALQSMKVLFSCEDFSQKSFASLINRARHRARSREAIKAYLFSLWMVGITAKRTAIHRTRRCRTKRISARPAADKAGGTKRTHKPGPVDATALRARARRRARGRTLVAATPRCVSVVNPFAVRR